MPFLKLEILQLRWSHVNTSRRKVDLLVCHVFLWIFALYVPHASIRATCYKWVFLITNSLIIIYHSQELSSGIQNQPNRLNIALTYCSAWCSEHPGGEGLHPVGLVRRAARPQHVVCCTWSQTDSAMITSTPSPLLHTVLKGTVCGALKQHLSSWCTNAAPASNLSAQHWCIFGNVSTV